MNQTYIIKLLILIIVLLSIYLYQTNIAYKQSLTIIDELTLSPL